MRVPMAREWTACGLWPLASGVWQRASEATELLIWARFGETGLGGLG